MTQSAAAAPTRRPQPLILVRGFGGLDVEDERRVAYQGFNDGTVYPQKRGENYIYEGLILRFLKSAWEYHDATNVVGYYSSAVKEKPLELPAELDGMAGEFFSGDKVIIDPAMARNLMRSSSDVLRTLWVFRYYDLDDRQFAVYGAPRSTSTRSSPSARPTRGSRSSSCRAGCAASRPAASSRPSTRQSSRMRTIPPACATSPSTFRSRAC